MTMAFLGVRGHPSRKTVLLFLGVAAVSVVTLIWMGVRLVRQDRALETQRLLERREAAADRLVVSVGQILSAEERILAELPKTLIHPPGEDAILLIVDSSGLQVRPEGALLFYPAVAPGLEPPAGVYSDAERSEFLLRDYDRAVRELRPRSESKDPAIKVGAQVRLARNFRKAGNVQAALEIYAEMIALPGQRVSISGVPADLAARRARCALLEEVGSGTELRKEARSLYDDLGAGRWHVDRASYSYYLGQAVSWLGMEPEPPAGRLALTEAADWLWQNRDGLARFAEASAGRRTLRFRGAAVTVLWRESNGRISALAAGAGYQRIHWFEPIAGTSDFRDVRLAARDSEHALVFGDEPSVGAPAASRPASATGLPWDITLVNADPAGMRGQFAQRRRLMVAGLGMLALLVITASYLIGRAVSRELAAARLQSDFVSAVSHEFRTPLTSMRQFTEMLVEDENLPPEKRRAFYAAQDRATRRLSRLVESLLDFGRMEAGARPYRLERLDAGRLVAATVEEFKREMGDSSLAIECAVPDSGPPVRAEAEALAQALWNLLDNAVKYSGSEPAIRVEVEGGPRVTIRVRDRGLGIAPSEKDRIFRKFVRGSSARVSGAKGTGIGLATVKHIVDAHGGNVVVESEPGRGSVFTIVLPAGD